MVEEEKNLFNQVIDKTDSRGDITKRTIISVDKYDTSDMPDYKEGDKVFTGLTCQIRVSKYGSDPKSSSVNFDPEDSEIKDALLNMYAMIEENESE